MNWWNIGLGAYLGLGTLSSAVIIWLDTDQARRLGALFGGAAALALGIHFLG